MNPAEFTAFAERLAVQPATTPASIRSATSRAYYGAFHQTRELLEEFGFFPGWQHSLQLWLIDCTNPTAQSIGRLLGDLQAKRIKADYRLEQTLAEEPQFGRSSVELARRIEALIVLCKSEPIRSEIKDELTRILNKRKSTPGS